MVKNLPDLILALRDADQYNLEHIKSWLCDDSLWAERHLEWCQRAPTPSNSVQVGWEKFLFAHSSCVNIDLLPTTKQNWIPHDLAFPTIRSQRSRKGGNCWKLKFDDSLWMSWWLQSGLGLYRSIKIDERVKIYSKNKATGCEEKTNFSWIRKNFGLRKVLKDKEKKIKAQEKMLKDYKRKRIMDDFIESKKNNQW